MNLTEQKIEKIEEARLDFLWKVQLFEIGLNYKKEQKVKLLEKIKEKVKFRFDLNQAEIEGIKIETLDEINFSYQLGKHIQSISSSVIEIFSEVIYPLDSLIEDYENNLKEILL